jgi:predicted N-acetyltransferase YhbS
MPDTHEYAETGLTRDLAVAIADLSAKCFPDSIRTLEERVEEILAAAGSKDPEKTSGRRFVIWQGNRPLAHARTFVRHIFAGERDIPVLALATVCSDPQVRGQGLGKQVTLRALEQVGQPGWPAVSLFQTPVAPFYEKLNCRIVSNRFVNRRNAGDPEANPWRDDTVMIYPADFDWPLGIVDLNGPDY